MIHFSSLLVPFKNIFKTHMLTLTHKAKNKWLLRGHWEITQKYSEFDRLKILTGICPSNQLPTSVYCIPYSKLLVKKKIGVPFPKSLI
jgi:hypothetical protein